jgi:hypothetical protein
MAAVPARVLWLAFAAGLALAVPASARVVEFPIPLDHAFVRQRVLETLFDGPDETTRVWRDPSQCNDVVLKHPRLSGRDAKLHLVADFDTKLGAPVGNWCLNATRRKGILDATLEPRLHPKLPIVEFQVVNSELLDPDGQKRFTGAIWDWVRSQVHPQLETIKVDLYQPVNELKTFLPVLFPGSDLARVKKLIESLALASVAVSEQGIALRVKLDVPEPRGGRSPHAGRPGRGCALCRRDGALGEGVAELGRLPDVPGQVQLEGRERRAARRAACAAARCARGHLRDPRLRRAAQRRPGAPRCFSRRGAGWRRSCAGSPRTCRARRRCTISR